MTVNLRDGHGQLGHEIFRKKPVQEQAKSGPKARVNRTGLVKIGRLGRLPCIGESPLFAPLQTLLAHRFMQRVLFVEDASQPGGVVYAAPGNCPDLP